MFEVATRLFDTTGFPPRKHCGDGWTPTLIWMHVTSDLFIWLAYLSIPLVLLYFTRRRDLPFPRLFLLFALFILACGTTHFLEALIFEHPVYRFAAVMKLVTAVVSWVTVLALVPVIPRVMHAVSLAAQPGAVTKQHRALTAADPAPAESRLRGYIVGLLAGVLAVLVRAALDPLVRDDHVFVVALLAVVYVSWRYGFGPGVLCLCVGVGGYAYFFVPPRPSLYVEGFGTQLAVALFFFCGAACAALGEAQRQAARRAGVLLASAVAWSKELETEVARRQAAEGARRASEERLRAFYDNSPVCMGVVEPSEGDIIHVYDNRASCAFFGVGPEGTGGRRASELGTPPAVRQLWLSKYHQSAERRAAVHFEYEYQAADGRRWLSATVAPLDSGDDRPLFCYVAEDVTARRRAEDDLRDSEARFRTMADHAPVMVWVTEPDGRCTFLSQSWYEFTGQTPQTGLGFGWLDAIHPDDRPAAESEFRAAVVAAAPFVVDYRLRRADGEYRWATDSATPRRGPGGEFLGFIGSVADIHDRKQAEADLRDSEARFRTLAQAVPHIVWVTRPDGYHEYFNARWYAYTGLTEAQSVGYQWSGPLHPDDRARAEARWKQATDTGEEYEIEYRFRGADGHYRWFLGRALPQRAPDGRVVRWYGTCTDIHDEKLAAEAVRRSEERFRLLTEAVPHVVWNADADGEITYLNRRWLEFTELPLAAAAGRGWLDAVHPDDRDRVLAAWRDTVERAAPGKDERFQQELRLKDARGGYRWFVSVAVPLRRADGSVDQWIGSMADVHDQKTAAETVRGLNEQLQFRMEELRSVLDAAPAAIWISQDRACSVITSNGTAARLLRAAPGDNVSATGARVAERGFREYGPDGAPISPDELPMQRAARDGVEVPGAELKMVFADGAVRHILGNAVPLRDAAGEVRGAVSAFVDITDRKRALEQVAEANKFLEATIDAMSGHVAVLAPDGTILKVNEAWRRFGRQNGLQLPGHGVGANYLDACDVACPSGRAAPMSDGIRAVIRGDAPRYQVEYPCHSPTEPRWFLMSVTRFPGAGPVRVVMAHENITARVQAELAIRESEAFRASVFENSPDCLKILDLDGRVLEMNEGGCRLMELDDFGALRGCPWGEMWPPASAAAVREAVAEARAGRVGRFQGFCPTARGTPKYWDVSVAAVPGADGVAQRLIAVSRDVTEQRRAEERVRQSEEQFRQLADSMPQIVFAARPDGTVDYFNRKWYEYTGFPADGPEGEAGWAAVHEPDRLDAVRERWLRAVRTGAEYEVEYRLRRHDGERRWHLGRALPVRDAAGDVVRWYGTNTDIHDAKLAAEALRASEGRFRTLTEAVPQMVWTADLRGEVTFFNRRWDEYTGVPLSTGQRQQWANNPIHPDDADRVRVGWQLAVAQGASSYSAEFRLRRAADGEYRWMLSVAVPLRDAAGDVAEWVGTLTDIDDQKRQAHTLERMVRERTAELEAANTALTGEVGERKAAEDQVRAVAVELERSNGELEKFAYVASHDLQEPLRKIQAFGDRLKTKCRDQLTDTGKEYVDRMLSAAGRMRRLIDDLLTFSRVTTQKRPLVRLDLDWLVREVVSDLDVRIGQAGGTVRVGPLPALDADPTQMRQLFQNLIANAVKFYRPGVPPVVEVWSEPAELPSDHADGAPRPAFRLSVRDNGIGFDEKYRERIFDVFQRLHGRDEYEGTGVGLAICRKIAERHGGLITAYSKEGEGATFVVTLPASQTHTREATADDV